MLPLDKFQFIFIDLPGHGLSSHLPAGNWYRLIDYVCAISRIADHFKWTTFSLLSHSMGSKIAYVYAGCYPDQVESLIAMEMPRPFRGISRVLLNVPVDDQWVLPDIYRDWMERLKQIEKVGSSFSVGRPFEEYVEKLVKGTGDYLTMESARIILRRGTKLVNTDPDLYVLTRDRRLDIYDFLLPIDFYNQFCQNIKCDLLMVLATKGITHYYKDFDLAILNVMKKNLKVFDIEYVEGTHHAHLNSPEGVAPVVNRFLLRNHY